MTRAQMDRFYGLLEWLLAGVALMVFMLALAEWARLMLIIAHEIKHLLT